MEINWVYIEVIDTISYLLIDNSTLHELAVPQCLQNQQQQHFCSIFANNRYIDEFLTSLLYMN